MQEHPCRGAIFPIFLCRGKIGSSQERDRQRVLGVKRQLPGDGHLFFGDPILLGGATGGLLALVASVGQGLSAAWWGQEIGEAPRAHTLHCGPQFFRVDEVTCNVNFSGQAWTFPVITPRPEPATKGGWRDHCSAPQMW